ncbi:MAG: alpha-N-acetylglucosaminidase TIM-barrel domain-containing protein, partial [bacterium]
MKRLFCALTSLLLALVVAQCANQEKSDILTRCGDESVFVVVRPQERQALQLAAKDLADYLGTMLNRHVPVRTDLPEVGSDGKVFLLATPASQTELPDALSERLSPKNLEHFGPDGCLAVSVPPVLLLAGNTGRGAANAVWTYLEEFCHVGFFWSDDFVPQLDELPFQEVSFKQIPRFAERYMSQPGTYTLSEHMDWPDWKKEIDWRAHKRQNIVYGPERSVIWKQVFAEQHGVEYVLSDADRWQDELNRKIAAYIRDRGLMMVMPGFEGEVPAEFVTAHPQVRYVGGIRWGDIPMNKHVYPADPMFHELTIRYMRAYTDRYGPAEYYFVPPYPEATPGDTEEEKHSIKIDLATAIQNALAEAYPGTIWLTDSWAFLTPEFWTPEEVRAFSEAVKDREHFRIYDTWGEERPMWKLHNAFWGNKWTFGVLQCFGGNTTLHGDLHSLVRDIQQVATDPAAENCVGVYLVPEAWRHNDLFFDLAMRLSWDPLGIKSEGDVVHLEPYIHDYALRRYGARSAGQMAKVLDILAQTVYASKDATQPVFLSQLWTVFDFPNLSVYVPPEQVAQASVLRKGLELGLREADSQRNNPLFERDIVDLARRYLGDVFNGVVPNVIYAWRAENEDRFQIAAEDSLRIMECVEDLLWSSKPYWLETRVEKNRDRPDFEEILTQTRNIMSIWEGSINLDYERRDDLAELMRGYYRPRMEAWLNRLAAVRPTDWSQADIDWLTQTYWDIGKKWVEKGNSGGKPTNIADTPTIVQRILPVAREIEQRWRLNPTDKMVNID